MQLDPKKHSDWEIAQAYEEKMKTVYQLGAELDLTEEELLPQGHFVAKVDAEKLLHRLASKPNGKYIDVTAITPTPLGEGKSTTTMGLLQGMGKRGKKVTGAIRQPSGGPTMNIKGGAAGGGLAQCIPLTRFSLGLTGDINAVMNAHNLAMTALTARMQHEFNYGDKALEKRNLRRLDIDPRRIEIGWVMDLCAQALRNMIIGIGGKTDGFMMESRTDMAVSSEVMAILSVARDLKDLRERMSRIVVAFDKHGDPVTTADLEVDGAMTAWMVEALKPNLLQTIEGQPCFVHAGPFANIAIGQSSILADRVGLKLADYHVTESGFGTEVGFEKFWNIKCRLSGLRPQCAVLVTTIRGLKCHGGGPPVPPGRKLDPEYFREHVDWVVKGSENMVYHIDIIKKSGINPVVCINAFTSDTKDEIQAARRIAEEAGARVAVSEHWEKGGDGAVELADAVIDACEDKSEFQFLYDQESSIQHRIETIATQVYGADKVNFLPEAEAKLEQLEKDENARKMLVCMVKTQLSLSHDPSLKGVPKGWTLPVRDILTYRGAGFLVPVTGKISLMPGTASDPAFRRIDVDVKTGKVTGLF